MTDQPYLDQAPQGFEPTMELRWIEVPHNEVANHAKLFDRHSNHVHRQVVLCQKWTGAFRDCWVRVPVR